MCAVLIENNVSFATLKLKSFTIWLPFASVMLSNALLQYATPSLSAATRSAFDVLVFSMSFAGFASPVACEQNVYEASATWPNELTKGANLGCRLEGVVFFWHFLRRTDDRAAYKRVKTFFARGNRVRGRSRLRRWSGRRRWFLLPEQSNGELPSMQ